MKAPILFASLLSLAPLSQTLAADLPGRQPRLPPMKCAASFTALGTAIGGSKTFGNYQFNLDLTSAGTITDQGKGALSGVRAGYRYTFGSGLFMGADILGFSGPMTKPMQCNLFNESNFSTGTSPISIRSGGAALLRAGYVSNGLLVSVAAGPSFTNSHVDRHYSYFTTYFRPILGGLLPIYEYGDLQPASNHKSAGWVISGSASIDLSNGWTPYLDYSFFNNGTIRMIGTTRPYTQFAKIHSTSNQLAMGLRYRF